MKSPLTTHILDTSKGKPAAGVAVVLEKQDSGSWQQMAKGKTDVDGRINNLLNADRKLAPGFYRLIFDTGQYFSSYGAQTIFPTVSIAFEVRNPSEHYHIPLLVSPFGYTTYRGS